MANDGQMYARLAKLSGAYGADGFRIIANAYTNAGSVGVAAEHMTARNRDTGKPKRSYYLEGSPYERGYLLGLLAEPEISDMAVNFVDNIVFDFIGLEFLNRFPSLQKSLVDLLQSLSQNTWAALPAHIHEEARGMLDGCKASNPNTRVTQPRLCVMNVGFDVLCAMIYSGKLLHEQIPQLQPEHISLPMLCNAFSVFGEAAGGGHYFVRDFMFATGGTLQNNMAHILHNPTNEQRSLEPLYPYVSVAAPGIIGSISAMNIRGVAAGLNMSPAANCDVEHIGINSLLLLRECIQKGASAYDAARIVQTATRGVTWNYVLSDGTNDTACTVEAGASWNSVDFLRYPPPLLRLFLPDKAFLSSHDPEPMQNGAMIRRYGAPFPEEYLGFNHKLWQFYQAAHDPLIRLYPDAFAQAGYINRTLIEKNCPSNHYFAPQRTGKGVFITTNHFLLPHMRLCAMDPWTALIESGSVNDIQWRYDELNRRIAQAIDSQGHIDYAAAKGIAEYLSPYGDLPQYYKNSPKSKDGQDIAIKGCTSLFDLKKKMVESHYGYYKDEWVKTTLPAYV